MSKAVSRGGDGALTNLRSIKPVNYDLSLFNLELGGSWSYEGLLKIDSKVETETDQTVLNVKELDVKSVEVLKKDGSSTYWHRQTIELTLKEDDRDHLLNRYIS